MCMIIISDRWKSEDVCMRLLRYMRDTFLKLDTTLNDESVRGKINKLIFLHTVRVSNKNALSGLWIKCLPLFRGNASPCTRTKNAKVGHFRFEAAPSLVGGLILDKSMGRYVLDVCCTVKCFNPYSLWQ
jgi:hypothetical protein